MVIGESKRNKNWKTHNEVFISSPMDEMVNVLDGSFPPDDQFLQTQDTLYVLFSEISEKKVPILRKSNSVAEWNSSLLRNQEKSVCIVIPEQKMLKKCNTIPLMKKLDESRSDVPGKKVLDKKVPPLRKSNNTRTKEINMIFQDRICEKMHKLTFKPIDPIKKNKSFCENKMSYIQDDERKHPR